MMVPIIFFVDHWHWGRGEHLVNYVAVRRKLCERLRIPTIAREGVCSSCEWVAQMVHGMVLRHEHCLSSASSSRVPASTSCEWVAAAEFLGAHHRDKLKLAWGHALVPARESCGAARVLMRQHEGRAARRGRHRV